MDTKVRKIATIFVIGSLLGVILLTVYNSVFSSGVGVPTPLTTTDVIRHEIKKPEKETEEKVEDKKKKEDEQVASDNETEETNDSEANTATTSSSQENRENPVASQGDSSSSAGVSQNDTVDVPPVVAETKQVSVQIIGADGTIASGNVDWQDGDSAYTVLSRLASQNSISISTTGWGNYVYVSAINGLAERDYGGMSGWYYRVNGVKPDIGAGHYTVQESDTVVWYYETN